MSEGKFDSVVKQSAESFVPGYKKAMGFLTVFFGDNDKSFQDALAEEYRDWVIELNKRVAALEENLKEQGKQLDELTQSQAAQVLEKLASAMAITVSDIKREALLNTAVRQLDPTLGGLAKRQFWWNTIANLDDIEVQFFKLVSEKDLAFYSDASTLYKATENGAEPFLNGLDAAPFIVTASKLLEQSPWVQSNSITGKSLMTGVIRSPLEKLGFNDIHRPPMVESQR